VHIFFFGQIEHREQVLNVTVHPAIGYKCVEVKLFAGCFGASHRSNQRFVLEEFAITDRLIDAGQILVYDPACADVKVSLLQSSPFDLPADLQLRRKR
jgi:hypothetical protein